MAAEFQFKRFAVSNEFSAMKINTDGVLLGAAVGVLPSDRKVLDIGTGTGTVALMLAQRLSEIAEDFVIEGIDIDGASASEAAANFASSPWKKSLRCLHLPLQEFQTDTSYDLIVSNPPYFDSSLTNPDERVSISRHSLTLSYADIIVFASTHLAPGGRLALIMPSDIERQLLREGRSRGLFASETLHIRTTERKAISRTIATFSASGPGTVPVSSELVIRKDGEYTGEYRRLVRDFYLYL